MTKNQYIFYKDHPDHAGAVADMFNTLYRFIKDIGIAIAKMTKEQKANEVRRIHDMLVTNNPVFPDSLDVFTTYATFMSDVAYGRCIIKDRSVIGLTSAFKTWLASSEILAEIQAKAAPRFASLNDPTHYKEKKLAYYLEDWPDDEIQRQLSIINMIGFKSLDFPGVGGYMARIFREAQKRNLEPLPIRK